MATAAGAVTGIHLSLDTHQASTINCLCLTDKPRRVSKVKKLSAAERHSCDVECGGVVGGGEVRRSRRRSRSGSRSWSWSRSGSRSWSGLREGRVEDALELVETVAEEMATKGRERAAQLARIAAGGVRR